MSGWIRRKFDAILLMRGIEAYRVYQRHSGYDVLFVEELRDVAIAAGGAGGGYVSVLNADGVPHEPVVDCFCGVGHVDFALEVGFGEDVGEGGCVVHVEAR